MNQLTQIKHALETWGVLTPWIVLIPVLMLFEFFLTKSRLFTWLEATYPWGAPVRKIIHAAPTVVFGALFNFLTTGSGDIESMIAGGMLGLLLHYKPPKPPTGGAAVGLALLVVTGCTAAQSAPPNPEREKCYVTVRAEFHRTALLVCTPDSACTRACKVCGEDEACTEACEAPCIDSCVDALTPQEKQMQEACP